MVTNVEKQSVEHFSRKISGMVKLTTNIYNVPAEDRLKPLKSGYRLVGESE